MRLDISYLCRWNDNKERCTNRAVGSLVSQKRTDVDCWIRKKKACRFPLLPFVKLLQTTTNKSLFWFKDQIEVLETVSLLLRLATCKVHVCFSRSVILQFLLAKPCPNHVNFYNGSVTLFWPAGIHLFFWDAKCFEGRPTQVMRSSLST